MELQRTMHYVSARAMNRSRGEQNALAKFCFFVLLIALFAHFLRPAQPPRSGSSQNVAEIAAPQSRDAAGQPLGASRLETPEAGGMPEERIFEKIEAAKPEPGEVASGANSTAVQPPAPIAFPAAIALTRRPLRKSHFASLQGMTVHEPSAPARSFRIREMSQFAGNDAENLHKVRLIGVQAVSAAGCVAVFQQFRKFFGGTAQPFKIGNDWDKDNTLHFDELLHFQGSYRLAQGMADLYRWAGVRAPIAEMLGAGLTAGVMTYLEYLDGRRPHDEASYSDLTANLLGVTFALLRPRVKLLRAIDFGVSYRNIRDPFTAKKLLNYDRLTHWLIIDAGKFSKMPFKFSLGYGVKDAFKRTVRPKYYLGISVGLGKLLGQHRNSTPGPLRWLDIYRIGVQWQIG